MRQQQRQWREHHAAASAALQGGATASLADFLWAAENVRSRAFSGPYTGSSVGDKARTFGLVAAAGAAYVALVDVPVQQALNGGIAALMFNVIYDVLLSKKLKWYAMCPLVDCCNHRSAVEVRGGAGVRAGVSRCRGVRPRGWVGHRLGPATTPLSCPRQRASTSAATPLPELSVSRLPCPSSCPPLASFSRPLPRPSSSRPSSRKTKERGGV